VSFRHGEHGLAQGRAGDACFEQGDLGGSGWENAHVVRHTDHHGALCLPTQVVTHRFAGAAGFPDRAHR
jgi:hypothetical protein